MTPSEDPFSMFEGWDSSGLWILAILVPVAILVFWYGSRQFSRQRGGSSLRPRGRPGWWGSDGEVNDAAFREKVAALEKLPPTPIAKAQAGVVRIVATIVNASGNLGGRSNRQCVWRNRAGARPDSAVAADLVIVADETGRCGIENLEHAKVIAPAERHGHHWENVSLYFGDEIEIVATFTPEPNDDARARVDAGTAPDDEREADPATEASKMVYGTLGSDAPMQVRLVQRSESIEPSPTEADPS